MELELDLRARLPLLAHLFSLDQFVLFQFRNPLSLDQPALRVAKFALGACLSGPRGAQLLLQGLNLRVKTRSRTLGLGRFFFERFMHDRVIVGGEAAAAGQ